MQCTASKFNQTKKIWTSFLGPTGIRDSHEAGIMQWDMHYEFFKVFQEEAINNQGWAKKSWRWVLRKKKAPWRLDYVTKEIRTISLFGSVFLWYLEKRILWCTGTNMGLDYSNVDIKLYLSNIQDTYANGCRSSSKSFLPFSWSWLSKFFSSILPYQKPYPCYPAIHYILSYPFNRCFLLVPSSFNLLIFFSLGLFLVSCICVQTTLNGSLIFSSIGTNFQDLPIIFFKNSTFLMLL